MNLKDACVHPLIPRASDQLRPILLLPPQFRTKVFKRPEAFYSSPYFYVMMANKPLFLHMDSRSKDSPLKPLTHSLLLWYILRRKCSFNRPSHLLFPDLPQFHSPRPPVQTFPIPPSNSRRDPPSSPNNTFHQRRKKNYSYTTVLSSMHHHIPQPVHSSCTIKSKADVHDGANGVMSGFERGRTGWKNGVVRLSSMVFEKTALEGGTEFTIASPWFCET